MQLEVEVDKTSDDVAEELFTYELLYTKLDESLGDSPIRGSMTLSVSNVRIDDASLLRNNIRSRTTASWKKTRRFPYSFVSMTYLS